jgi:glutathione S-transferase
MMAPVRRLLTIPISHYCEKARWALERAGLAYSEERHVQGIHILVARRAGGRETVPVLIADEGVFNESEDILRYADRNLPDAARLFPAGDHEVETLSRWLDEGLGPDGRRLMYVQMLAERKQMLQVNNQGVPRWEARMMATLWPLATRLAGRRLGLAPDTIEKDSARVIRSFDAIAERRSDGRPYLCGDRFTAADLTFACLASSILVPPEYGVRLPQPDELPEHIASQVRAFREHPAGAYALELFRTERRVSVAQV